MGGPDLDVGIQVFLRGARPYLNRMLDLIGIAPDLLAPLPQHLRLTRVRLRIAEAVPDIGILRDEAQRLPLATAANQDWNRIAHRRRHINRPALFDDP